MLKNTIRNTIIIVLIFSYSFSFSQTEKKIDSLLLLLQNQKTVNKLDIYANLCLEYFNNEKIKKSLEYGKKALLLADTSADYKANINNVVAKCYYKTGNYLKSKNILTQNIELCKKNNLDILLGEAYRTCANLYWRQGKNKIAIDYNLKALKIFQAKKDSGNMALVYPNLTGIYTDLKEFDKADSVSNISLKLFLGLKNMGGVAKVYENKGIIQFFKKNYPESRKYYYKSLEINLSQNIKSSAAVCYGNIAETYEMTRDYKKAIQFYLKAYNMLIEFDYKSGIIFLYYGIARTYNKMHKSNKALEYYFKSMKLAEQIGEIREKPMIYKLISETYESLNNYKNAFIYYKKYEQVKDSIFNSEKFKQIEEIRTKFNTERTEQKNILLKKENILKNKELEKMNIRQTMLIHIIGLFVIIIGILLFLRKKLKQKNTTIYKQKNTISSQYEEIRQQNNELSKYQNHLKKLVEEKTQKLQKALLKAKESEKLKTAFLNNIFHEVRTPMNSILGFSEILTMKTDGEKNEYLKHIVENVKELGSLIDDIVELSELQTLSKKAVNRKIIIKDFFKELVLFTEDRLLFYERTNIELLISLNLSKNKTHFVSDENKTKKIIQHLLDNAIKYTQSGKVIFTCRQNNNELIFRVEDTGIGIENKKLNKIFDTFSKIEEKDMLFRGAGIGLAIVKEYSKIINAKVSVSSIYGKGTTFELIIPIKKG